MQTDKDLFELIKKRIHLILERNLFQLLPKNSDKAQKAK